MKSGVPRGWPRFKDKDMDGCEGKARREIRYKWSNEEKRKKGGPMKDERKERKERREKKKKRNL